MDKTRTAGVLVGQAGRWWRSLYPARAQSVDSAAMPASRSIFFLMIRRPPRFPLFPYPTLFRSMPGSARFPPFLLFARRPNQVFLRTAHPMRSEEHTSELQSLRHLVCRLLLE